MSQMPSNVITYVSQHADIFDERGDPVYLPQSAQRIYFYPDDGLEKVWLTVSKLPGNGEPGVAINEKLQAFFGLATAGLRGTHQGMVVYGYNYYRPAVIPAHNFPDLNLIRESIRKLASGDFHRKQALDKDGVALTMIIPVVADGSDIKSYELRITCFPMDD